MKKPMAKKSMAKKSAKKAAPMMMSGSMMKTGGKMMMKAQKGVKTPMQKYKAEYPKADTSAAGDTRFGDEVNAYGPKKVLDKIAAGDKAFNAKYGKDKPAVDKAKPKAKPKAKMGMKVSAKNGMHKMPGGKMMENSSMKKGGKVIKKK